MNMNYLKLKPIKSFDLNLNGAVERTSSMFTIINHFRVEPGAEIIASAKAQRQKMTSAEALSFGSAMASVALVLVTIIKTLNP
jgi:hypothetical protein